jgi:hypothetical protein
VEILLKVESLRRDVEPCSSAVEVRRHEAGELESMASSEFEAGSSWFLADKVVR